MSGSSPSLTLTNLRRAVFSQKNIKELVVLVSMWNKSMARGNGIISCCSGKLDTELIDVRTQRNNSNYQQQQNNGSQQLF